MEGLEFYIKGVSAEGLNKYLKQQAPELASKDASKELKKYINAAREIAQSATYKTGYSFDDKNSLLRIAEHIPGLVKSDVP